MTKTKKKSSTPVPLSAEDHDRIQKQITIRAYELWQQAGCPHGNDRDHWLQAEREILERQN
ncbi:MAG: DUF2934 domain-containing protein [Limisphaerales bacterium]